MFAATCNPPCEHGYCIKTNECVCKEGYTGSSCETEIEYCGDAMCQSWGDPHFTTFDGTFFDYMGQCSYHLLKVDDDALNVIIKNIDCVCKCIQVIHSFFQLIVHSFFSFE